MYTANEKGQIFWADPADPHLNWDYEWYDNTRTLMTSIEAFHIGRHTSVLFRLAKGGGVLRRVTDDLLCNIKDAAVLLED